MSDASARRAEICLIRRIERVERHVLETAERESATERLLAAIQRERSGQQRYGGPCTCFRSDASSYVELVCPGTERRVR